MAVFVGDDGAPGQAVVVGGVGGASPGGGDFAAGGGKDGQAAGEAVAVEGFFEDEVDEEVFREYVGFACLRYGRAGGVEAGVVGDGEAAEVGEEGVWVAEGTEGGDGVAEKGEPGGEGQGAGLEDVDEVVLQLEVVAQGAGGRLLAGEDGYGEVAGVDGLQAGGRPVGADDLQGRLAGGEADDRGAAEAEGELDAAGCGHGVAGVEAADAVEVGVAGLQVEAAAVVGGEEGAGAVRLFGDGGVFARFAALEEAEGGGELGVAAGAGEEVGVPVVGGFVDGDEPAAAAAGAAAGAGEGGEDVGVDVHGVCSISVIFR